MFNGDAFAWPPYDSTALGDDDDGQGKSYLYQRLLRFCTYNRLQPASADAGT